MSSSVAKPLEDGSIASAVAEIEQSCDRIRDWQESVQNRLAQKEAEIASAHDTIRGVQGALAQVREECDRWKADCESARADVERRVAELAGLTEANRQLRRELLDLYRDLQGPELPPMILRIGMSLTDAKQGLYTNAQVSETYAAVGLDDCPAPVRRVLDDYARRAAEDKQPLVENERQTLPDGTILQNLAAVPVAIKGDLHGVLLVADKPSGPFTDEDTELLLSIGRHAGVALENRRLHHALAEAYLSTIAVLADAIEAKDPYTRGHCEGVAAVAVEVGRRMGFDGDDLDRVRYAALLHDVGKIGISDGILLKPGRLLPEEYQVIKRHSVIGSDLVSRVPALSNIAPLILHHHERYDGMGYPAGLSGEDIPLASRIIGVVDALDAMTTPRPYRDALPTVDAMAELRRCAGEQFDPNVVQVVSQVIEERTAVVAQ